MASSFIGAVANAPYREHGQHIRDLSPAGVKLRSFDSIQEFPSLLTDRISVKSVNRPFPKL
ncbi:hypothetical protein GCM10007362_45560 [Saccharibacillus endophyticus]|uniref:Uncharacterized protein n=1 Tax=Saccharibacillus endophyticus TaxID=2060666 RepID=A0ABQ2A6E5_9BACL|nr:hypothetical protein GCM10007362_45560 [Saccharibacillus endophyticus]